MAGSRPCRNLHVPGSDCPRAICEVDDETVAACGSSSGLAHPLPRPAHAPSRSGEGSHGRNPLRGVGELDRRAYFLNHVSVQSVTQAPAGGRNCRRHVGAAPHPRCRSPQWRPLCPAETSASDGWSKPQLRVFRPFPSPDNRRRAPAADAPHRNGIQRWSCHPRWAR